MEGPDASFVTVVSELGTLLACVEIPADGIQAEALHLMACHHIDPDIVPSTMWLYHPDDTAYARDEQVTSEVVLKCRKGDNTAIINNNNNNEEAGKKQAPIEVHFGYTIETER